MIINDILAVKVLRRIALIGFVPVAVIMILAAIVGDIALAFGRFVKSYSADVADSVASISRDIRENW